MKTREQLEKLRRPIPEAMEAALAACEGCDYSEHVIEDDHGVYSTGLFRYKGKDVLVTLDGGKWHLSASTNHPIGYYEMKELRYEFLPDGIRAAQIFPPRSEFVNISENCYHLFEIDSDMSTLLSNQRPTYDELTEQSAKPVTGSDLKFQHLETARTICKSMIDIMLADGLTKSDLPQTLNDVCKLVILSEANVDKKSALFVLDRFTRLSTELSIVMMRIIRHQAEEMDQKEKI